MAAFAQMSADKEVMRYFPDTLTQAQSNAIARKCQQLIEDNGYGFWAVGLKPDNQFIGFVGLHQVANNLPFAPAVEIGWRLHRDYWGYGYATEAAQTALAYAFMRLGFDEVVSFTAAVNQTSQKLMKRIGMVNTQQDFYHPALSPSSHLAHHVLYRITYDNWRAQ